MRLPLPRLRDAACPTTAAPRRVIPTLVLGFGLIAAAVLTYANALRNGFAFDDFYIVQHNFFIRDLVNLKDLAVTRYWPNVAGPAALYRPTTMGTYFADWALGHGQAWIFHLGNAVWHGVTAALLAILLVRLGASRLAAAVAGLLFVVHPVHVEAVANVVGRAEILSALCCLAAIHAYLWRPRARVLRVFAVAVLYLLSLGAKEGGVMLPALLVLVEWIRPGRTRVLWRAVWDELPLWLALGIALGTYVVLRGLVLGFSTVVDTPPGIAVLTAGVRTATAVRVWPEYLRLLFVPRDLVADYAPGVLIPVTWASARTWVGLGVGVASILATWRLARISRWWAVAWAWFVLTIFVVSNLAVPVGIWLAERTLYLPSIAVAFVVVAIAETLPRRWMTVARVTPVVFILLALGAWRTWTRTPVWDSTETVMASLVREHPESFRAYQVRGRDALAAGDVRAAVPLLEHAHDLVPRDGHVSEALVHAWALAGQWTQARPLARTICSRTLYGSCLDYARALQALGRSAELDSVAPAIWNMLPPIPAAFATMDSIAPRPITSDTVRHAAQSASSEAARETTSGRARAQGR